MDIKKKMSVSSVFGSVRVPKNKRIKKQIFTVCVFVLRFICNDIVYLFC